MQRALALEALLYRASSEANVLDAQFLDHITHIVRHHRWRDPKSMYEQTEAPPPVEAPSEERRCLAHDMTPDERIVRCGRTRAPTKRCKFFCPHHRERYQVLKSEKERACQRAQQAYEQRDRLGESELRELLKNVYACVELRAQIIHIFFRPGTAAEHRLDGHLRALSWFRLEALSDILARLTAVTPPPPPSSSSTPTDAKKPIPTLSSTTSAPETIVDPIEEIWRVVEQDRREARRMQTEWLLALETVFASSLSSWTSALVDVDDRMLDDAIFDGDPLFIAGRAADWRQRYAPLYQRLSDEWESHSIATWMLYTQREEFVDTATDARSHAVTKAYVVLHTSKVVVVGTWIVQDVASLRSGRKLALQGFFQPQLGQHLLGLAANEWAYPDHFPLGPFGAVGNVFVLTDAARARRVFEETRNRWVAPDKTCVQKDVHLILSGESGRLEWDTARFRTSDLTVDATKRFNGAFQLVGGEHLLPYLRVTLTHATRRVEHKTMPFTPHTEFQRLHI